MQQSEQRITHAKVRIKEKTFKKWIRSLEYGIRATDIAMRSTKVDGMCKSTAAAYQDSRIVFQLALSSATI
jgi:hypothetical protein